MKPPTFYVFANVETGAVLTALSPSLYAALKALNIQGLAPAGASSGWTWEGTVPALPPEPAPMPKPLYGFEWSGLE